MKNGPGQYCRILTRENFQFAWQAGAAQWHAGMAHALGFLKAGIMSDGGARRMTSRLVYSCHRESGEAGRGDPAGFRMDCFVARFRGLLAMTEEGSPS